MKEMKTFRLLSLMEKFKEQCKTYGWRTSDSDDWIAVGDEYHKFLVTRSIHPSSFKAITANRKCVVRNGLLYRVVDAAYTAWLFSEKPPEKLAQIIFETPEFSKHIALYDLNPLLGGYRICIRVNYTDSLVFREFENFLRRECRVRFKRHPLLKRASKDLAAAVT
ncbi:hypothetical protein H5T51_05480 [Candidatus Bathyarchaeota archaeon]|nr:hypothetical protein [Candidatus Bathyarchaeota archaeon]